MGVSFNANQLKYNVRNANSVLIMVGDQPIAFGQSSNWDLGISTDPLFQIGSLKPQEIQQLRALPSITIDGFMLTNTGQKLAGMSNDISYYIMNNSFNIALYDAPGTTDTSLTGPGQQQVNLLYLFVNCTATSFSFSIPANSILSEALSFYAEDVFGSDGQTSLLNSNSAYQLATTLVNQVTSL